MGGCDQIGKTQPKETRKIIPTNERGRSHNDERTDRRSFILIVKLGRNPIERRRRKNRVDDVEDKRCILGFDFMFFDFLTK